jgi:hypothetical protein
MGKRKPKASKNKRKRVERYEPSCFARTVANEEVGWLFQEAPGLMGVHGINLNGSGGGFRPDEAGWMSLQQVNAASRYRRVVAGLRRLSPRVRAVLSKVFELKQHGEELHEYFGGLENLALAWPSVRVRFEAERRRAVRAICQHYLKNDAGASLMQLDTDVREARARFSDPACWLTGKVKSDQAFAERIRKELDCGAAGALRHYANARIPTRGEQRRKRERREERQKTQAEPRESRRSLEATTALVRDVLEGKAS